ncbi:MAG: hypothetical protein IT168_05195 [Bryobacterales bacterium]|nr:hypothetical protein [Bryobacterales bacterium]
MKLALSALWLTIGLLVVATPQSFAKPEFMKKEKKGCTYCHTTAKGPDLNATGKYYKEKKTLDGAPKK